MTPELDNLDQRLREHYQRHTLTPRAMQRIKEKIRSEPVAHITPTTPSSALSRLSRLAWVGAVCSAVAAVGVLVVLLSLPRAAQSDVAQLAAVEVAANHHKQFTVEFATDDAHQLAAQMVKLDFTPVLPARLSDAAHRLLGARYCSLRGQTAALIRLADAKGRLCTLYEARPVGALADLRECQFEIDGCEIEIWHEAGLVMVLASPAH